MSQYPSPYSPPSYPLDYQLPITPGAAGLGLARRAGGLMIASSGMVILLGMCMAGMGQMLRSTPLPPDLQNQIRQMEAQAGYSVSAVTLTAGIILVAFAAIGILAGIYARTGRRPAIVLGLIYTGLALAVLGFAVVTLIVTAFSHGAPQAIVGIFVWSIPLAVFSLQFAWLIAAARNVPSAVESQQQFQTQVQQYQQNMLAYGNYGYSSPAGQGQTSGTPLPGYPAQPSAAATPPPLPAHVSIVVATQGNDERQEQK